MHCKLRVVVKNTGTLRALDNQNNPDPDRSDRKMATVYFGTIQVVFCLCLITFITTVSSLLDLEELKNVHYEIDISDKPVLIGRVSCRNSEYQGENYCRIRRCYHGLCQRVHH